MVGLATEIFFVVRVATPVLYVVLYKHRFSSISVFSVLPNKQLMPSNLESEFLPYLYKVRLICIQNLSISPQEVYSDCTLHNIIGETKIIYLTNHVKHSSIHPLKLSLERLINSLANMGLCSTYYDAGVSKHVTNHGSWTKYRLGAFAQFAFDNYDFNVNTIEGHNRNRMCYTYRLVFFPPHHL